MSRRCASAEIVFVMIRPSRGWVLFPRTVFFSMSSGSKPDHAPWPAPKGWGPSCQCLDYIDQIGGYSRFIEPELQHRLDAIRQSQLARFLRTLPASVTLAGRRPLVYRFLDNPFSEARKKW